MLFNPKFSVSWLSIFPDQSIWLNYLPMNTSMCIIGNLNLDSENIGDSVLSLLSPSQCDHGRNWVSFLCALYLIS